MMASKSKRLRQNTELLNKTIKRIGYLSVFVFLVKLLIIWRISNLTISQVQGHIWLGADGENYLKGVDGLVKEGLLSKAEILNYWPAGYPILIYILSFFGTSWALTLLAIAQTLLFSVVTYFFAKEIFQSRLRKFTFIIFVLISFNPTLSLNSMVVGYESFAASLLILALTLILRTYRVRVRNQTILAVLVSSIAMFILTFMQPRFLLTAPLVLFGLIYVRFKNNLKRAVMVFAVSALIVAIAPISLIIRNHVAINLNVISTNLGVTMAIGAGNTNGGYNGSYSLPCQVTSENPAIADRQKVQCVIKWYFENPRSALKLFYNKSIYFWSPWFGPEANGTMARNPWLTIHPFKNMTKTQDGINLLYGSLGKIISWIWLLSGLFLVFYGFLILWRQKFEVRLIAGIAGFIVFSSWLVTLISIGDHRFRLPIMGASLFLQAVGIRTLFAGGKPPMVQPVGLR
mgnify:CR=1 FL=1